MNNVKKTEDQATKDIETTVTNKMNEQMNEWKRCEIFSQYQNWTTWIRRETMIWWCVAKAQVYERDIHWNGRKKHWKWSKEEFDVAVENTKRVYRKICDSIYFDYIHIYIYMCVYVYSTNQPTNTPIQVSKIVFLCRCLFAKRSSLFWEKTLSSLSFSLIT